MKNADPYIFQYGRDVEETETLACRKGLMLAAAWCPENVVVEKNCSSIASMLSRRSGQRSAISFITREAIEAGD
jgi:hypothetical protein